MKIKCRKANIDDLDLLVSLRIEALIDMYKYPETNDFSLLRTETEKYYRENLNTKHLAYLCYVDDELAATVAASIYQVMPTYYNPSGHKAYIMNVYTRQAYRNCGLAKQNLKYLLDDLNKRNIGFITLEATNMGRPLYEGMGFIPQDTEMIIPKNALNKFLEKESF